MEVEVLFFFLTILDVNYNKLLRGFFLFTCPLHSFSQFTLPSPTTASTMQKLSGTTSNETTGLNNLSLILDQSEQPLLLFVPHTYAASFTFAKANTLKTLPFFFEITEHFIFLNAERTQDQQVHQSPQRGGSSAR